MTRKTAAARITDPALDLAGLKLRLAETIARGATKHGSPADREIYLQRQRHAMRADARAAGLSTPVADDRADNVISWVRRMIAVMDERR
jgi:hypothetical protein